jgi:hypothetical protein
MVAVPLYNYHIERQSGRDITIGIIQDATNILKKTHKGDLFIKLCIEIWFNRPCYNFLKVNINKNLCQS